MVKFWQTVAVVLGVWALSQPHFSTPVEAQLDPLFYLPTCPQVFSIVAKGVYSAILNETRNAAFLTRLFFHDCFVQGCDGSILLDSTPSLLSEQFATANNNSIGGIGVISSIKESVESTCPGIVSCADIVALSAFFSVVLSGGPVWLIGLGRRDSLQAGNSTLLTNLPAPFNNFTTLQSKFTTLGFTDQDLVALSGAHTIGLSRCISFTSRLYNFTSDPPGPDPTLNATLLADLVEICPFGGNISVTTNMDLQTPTIFDNLYYQNLLQFNGLFQTDELLFTGDNGTKALVETYASNQTQFFVDFAASMIKMGTLNISTGTEGEVRLNCSVSNSDSNSASSYIAEVIDRSRDLERESGISESERARITENAVEFFENILREVAAEVYEDELKRETARETGAWGHTSM